MLILGLQGLTYVYQLPLPSILVKSQAPKKHKVQATRAHFGIFLVTAWSYRALQKNSTSISQGKIDEQCWEFKGKLTNLSISQFQSIFHS